MMNPYRFKRSFDEDSTLSDRLFNLLYYSEELDAIALMEIEDNQLKLYDLVWTKICKLADLLERIPQSIEEVIFYFSPDRFEDAVDLPAFPHKLDGDSFLMVRGAFAAESEKFMLPRSARC